MEAGRGCALPLRGSRGRLHKLRRALALSLANTIVLSGDVRLACSGRDPQKICYLLFVICHLPSGRSARPAQPFFRPSGEPDKR
ncbi:MAG: hypothetical protein QOH31_5476 [Verrucomicrobiota bacterium]